MFFEVLPWSFYTEDNQEVRFWIHYGLVSLGFLLAVITFIVQWIKPAPYGKLETKEEAAKWGPMVPQQLAHTISDFVPGVILFILVFFLYGTSRSAINYVFLVLFLIHYVQRGALHPVMMRYSNSKVALGISLGALFPNCLYHFVNADFVGSAKYSSNYYYDPRFILGVLLFVVGFIINRWADYKLRSLRHIKGEDGCNGYYIPYGGLYELITCPNYFGELVEWVGWTICTWSLAGLVWCLFAAATFIPRSRHTHEWYQKQFNNYPPNRKALLPFIF